MCQGPLTFKMSKSDFITSFSPLSSKSQSLTLSRCPWVPFFQLLPTSNQYINQPPIKSPSPLVSLYFMPLSFPSWPFLQISHISSCWRIRAILLPLLCLYVMYLGLWSNSCVPVWCLSLSVNANYMRAWTGSILVLSVQFILIELIIDSIWLLAIASSPISLGLALLYFICYVAKQNKILKHISACHVPTHPSKHGKVWTSLYNLCFHDLVPTNISSLIYFCCSPLPVSHSHLSSTPEPS